MLSLPPLPDIFGNYAIKGLSEVIPPSAISWLPSTRGWQVLAVIVLCGLLWRSYRYFQYRRRNRYRQQAINQLDALLTNQRSASTLLAQLGGLLKATALYRYPRHEIAQLSGVNWVLWLQAHSNNAGFCGASQQLLSQGVYQPGHTVGLASIHQLAEEIRLWIRQHPEPEHA
jgi:hypothetical protein